MASPFMQFSRRAILAAAPQASLLGASAASAAERRPSPPALEVGLFKDVASLAIDEAVQAIRTCGHSRPGVGAATYVRSKRGGAKPWRTRSADGRWFELAPDETATPARFGAPLDGVGDDAPAIQAALDYVQLERERGVVDLEGKTYLCLSGPLRLDPVRAGLRGGGAMLDFSRRKSGGDDAAVLIRAEAGSSQYGHAPFELSGFALKGPGPDSALDGLVFDTAVPALSSRVVAHGVDVHGFRTGLKFRNRAYTIKFYGLDVYDCGACVEFVAGAQDAGENISFYGCTLFNSGVAVRNSGGAGLFLFGCSLDYCRQWYVGSGTTNFTSCWFEMRRPTAATQYPFDLTGPGDLIISGGNIMIGGADFALGPAHDYLFHTASKFSRVRLRDVAGYNWRTASGELLGGPGRLDSSGLSGGANHQIPAVTKRDARHNLFGAAGAFEGDTIALNAWPTGGNRRVDRHRVEWRNAAGGLGGAAALEISPDAARSGRKSLRFAKTGVGAGTGAGFHLAAPTPPRASVGAEFWYRCPRLPGGGKATLYFEAHFAALVGTDADGAPVVGDRVFFGGANETVDLERGGADWKRVSFQTTYADDTSPGDGYAPDWATHVLISCNAVHMPAGFVLHIDDLAAFAL